MGSAGGVEGGEVEGGVLRGDAELGVVDDQFTLQVEIQMADHPALSNGTIQEVFIAVKFGDTIVVGKCKYTSYISFLGATK